MITGGMLGDCFALEGCEGVGEERCAPAAWFPVEAGESVGSGRGGASREGLVLPR